MQASEAGSHFWPFSRVLQGDRLFEKMPKGYFQAVYDRCNRIHDSILVLDNNV
jgi:hypothetical protein